MSLEKNLTLYLRERPEIKGLVSDRISPLFISEGAPSPSIAYRRISTNPSTTHNGADGAEEVRMQFNIVGVDYEQTEAVALAIAQYLNGKGNIAIGNGRIGHTIKDNDFALYSPNAKRIERIVDYLIFYEERDF